MINCNKCGKKLWFFHKKYDHFDENKNTIIYCNECHQKFNSQNEFVRDVTRANAPLFSEIQILKDENNSLIEDYCKKYILSKEDNFKYVLFNFYENKKFLEYIIEDGNDPLFLLKECFMQMLQQNQNISLNTSAEYEEQMRSELMYNNILEFLKDLEMIKKILCKKNIEVKYKSLIEILVNIVISEVTHKMDTVINPYLKRLSKKTNNKKEFILECLKLGIDVERYNIFLYKHLFEIFKLEFIESEIVELLNECKEILEMDNFEKNFSSKKNKALCDFKDLSGHQFEDWLKDLFEIKGYQVTRTKLSGDQGADLIIKKENIKIVIQAKKYKGTVTNKAIQEVVASKKYYDATNAMVITTGSFTKSAFELAKSNNVELWDRDRLISILKEINETSANNDIQRFSQSTSISKSGDEFCVYVECPFCMEKYKIFETEMPILGQEIKKDCPACNSNMSIQISNLEHYSCRGCKNQFNKIIERRLHEENCNKFKSGQFNCFFCMKEFHLDDYELEELDTKGQIRTECPSCKKTNELQKRDFFQK